VVASGREENKSDYGGRKMKNAAFLLSVLFDDRGNALCVKRLYEKRFLPRDGYG
jgi:hypothetical protein